MTVGSKEELFPIFAELFKYLSQLGLCLNILEWFSYHSWEEASVSSDGQNFVVWEMHVIFKRQIIDVLCEVEIRFPLYFSLMNHVYYLTDDGNLASIEICHYYPVWTFYFLHLTPCFRPLQVLVRRWRAIKSFNFFVSEFLKATNRMKHFIILS